MDEKTATKFLKRARVSARKFGFIEDAEDLAQDVLVAFLKNPQTKQTVDQAVLDAVRASFGRVRGGNDDGQSIRKRGKRKFIALEDAPEIPAGAGPGYSGLRPIDADILSTLGRFLQGGAITILEHASFILTYGWGLRLEEVGLCFGVSGSRICQGLTRVEARISQALAAEEQRVMAEIPTQVGIKTGSETRSSQEVEKMGGNETEVIPLGANCRMEAEEFWALESDHEAGIPEWFA